MSDRALLTDFDGVLRRWPATNDRRAEAIGGLPLGSIAKAAFATDCVTPAIRGLITDSAWREATAVRLECLAAPERARAAVESWSCSVGEVVAEVHALYREARRAVRLILVTNATDRLPADLKALGLTDAFDGVVNSSAVGHEKPREEIFAHALAVAEVEPHQALFVDDSPQNVAAAERLGLRAHLFTSPEPLGAWLNEQGLT